MRRAVAAWRRTLGVLGAEELGENGKVNLHVHFSMAIRNSKALT